MKLNVSLARDIADRMTIDLAVMVGKPVIKGTRMPAELVLAKRAANPGLDAVFLDDPELTIADVRAVLTYASTLVPKPEDTAATREDERCAFSSTKVRRPAAPGFSLTAATTPPVSVATTLPAYPTRRCSLSPGVSSGS